MCRSFSTRYQTTTYTYLSTAMATRVKTDAETDAPCTKPLILHTALEKGQPVEKTELGRVIHMFVTEPHSEYSVCQSVD